MSAARASRSRRSRVIRRHNIPGDAQPRPGPPRRPPRPPRALRRRGRALRGRAVEGARPHREDQRARRPRRRAAHLARDRRRERAAGRRATALAAGRHRAGERPGRRARRLPRALAGGGMIALTAAQAAERIKAGDLDAGEYFAFYRERAERDDLNSFIWVADEPRPGGDGPLGGVPVAIKDLFCTKGIPSQAGSRILEGYRPPYDATSVERLYAAGAPLLGKTNQDEFAMGSSTENSGYGPTLNPWDRTRVPGGSSGGSAAAVAAGTAAWASGTDTGGSTRQPAALCGIVGLKPTYGAVSRYGMIAFASSLDQAGPFTRDVRDAALLLAAMQGHDPCDSTSLGIPEDVRVPSATDLQGIRIGVPEELTGEGIEPGVLAAFNATLDIARELG